jgi:hypothetical protein
MFVNINQVIAGVLQPYAFESITIDDTVGGVGLTASKYKPGNDPNNGNASRDAARVFITVETAACRYNYDGTAPTSTTGHLLGAGDVITLVGDDAIRNFRAIRTGASSTLQVTYER